MVIRMTASLCIEFELLDRAYQLEGLFTQWFRSSGRLFYQSGVLVRHLFQLGNGIIDLGEVGLKQYLKNLFKSIHLIFYKKLNIYCYINIICFTRFLTFALVHSTRVCYDHLWSFIGRIKSSWRSYRLNRSRICWLRLGRLDLLTIGVLLSGKKECLKTTIIGHRKMSSSLRFPNGKLHCFLVISLMLGGISSRWWSNINYRHVGAFSLKRISFLLRRKPCPAVTSSWNMSH